ncbi:MAG: endoglucanase [Flavobacteriaceae bacterium]|jgi:endoglucanase
MIEYFEHNLANIKRRADKNPCEVGHLFIWWSINLAAVLGAQAMLFEEMRGS